MADISGTNPEQDKIAKELVLGHTNTLITSLQLIANPKERSELAVRIIESISKSQNLPSKSYSEIDDEHVFSEMDLPSRNEDSGISILELADDIELDEYLSDVKLAGESSEIIEKHPVHVGQHEEPEATRISPQERKVS